MTKGQNYKWAKFLTVFALGFTMVFSVVLIPNGVANGQGIEVFVDGGKVLRKKSSEKSENEVAAIQKIEQYEDAAEEYDENDIEYLEKKVKELEGDKGQIRDYIKYLRILRAIRWAKENHPEWFENMTSQPPQTNYTGVVNPPMTHYTGFAGNNKPQRESYAGSRGGSEEVFTSQARVFDPYSSY